MAVMPAGPRTLPLAVAWWSASAARSRISHDACVMTRLLSCLLVVLLLGGFGAIAYRGLRAQAEAGKGMPPYSVYSEEGDGLAEAYRVVRRFGWIPVALTRPVQHTHDRGLLILVEPRRGSPIPGLDSDVSEADARALLRWVEEGNTLLLCG